MDGGWKVRGAVILWVVATAKIQIGVKRYSVGAAMRWRFCSKKTMWYVERKEKEIAQSAFMELERVYDKIDRDALRQSKLRSV